MPAFLNLLKKLFNRILVIGNYIRLINKVIKNYIDPVLLLTVALQVNLVDKEAKNKNKKKVNNAFKLKLAYSSIKSS